METEVEAERSVNPADYYAFEVRSMEWGYVLSRLLASHPSVKPGEEVAKEVAFQIGGTNAKGEPVTMFFLSRREFPADKVAASIGQAPEAVEKAKVIRLKPFPVDPKLPKPTVDYYGRA